MVEPQRPVAPPTPVSIAFLICDQVIVDRDSNKKTIVGVFDRINVRQFPTMYAPLSLYARVIDAEGEYDVRIDYVKVADEAALARIEAKAVARDRHAPAEFSFRLPPIPIPSAGEYEFRLWMNGRYIHRVKFNAVQRDQT